MEWWRKADSLCTIGYGSKQTGQVKPRLVPGSEARKGSRSLNAARSHEARHADPTESIRRERFLSPAARLSVARETVPDDTNCASARADDADRTHPCPSWKHDRTIAHSESAISTSRRSLPDTSNGTVLARPEDPKNRRRKKRRLLTRCCLQRRRPGTAGPCTRPEWAPSP